MKSHESSGVPVRVISISKDPQLRSLRKMILTAAGFEVAAPETVEAAAVALAGPGFDVMLLSQTLTDQECDRLIALARTNVPGIKVLQLTRGFGPAGALRPDAQVDSLDKPDIIIRAIRDLIAIRDRSAKGAAARVADRTTPTQPLEPEMVVAASRLRRHLL